MWSIIEIIVGLILIICTLTIHSIGMYAVVRKFELNWPVFLNQKNEFIRQVYFVRLLINMLLSLIFEVLLIAIVLYLIQAFHDLRTAFYLTDEDYTTLGFGDILLPPNWRQLALFIAMSGVFSFGWSTGVLVNLVGKIYEVEFSNLRKPK